MDLHKNKSVKRHLQLNEIIRNFEIWRKERLQHPLTNKVNRYMLIVFKEIIYIQYSFML